jgi:hypothetical protein
VGHSLTKSIEGNHTASDYPTFCAYLRIWLDYLSWSLLRRNWRFDHEFRHLSIFIDILFIY